MNNLTKALVSNSEMIKNYKTCRGKAEICGNVFILKNNQPDAVLFSISEYERLAEFIDYIDNLEAKEIAKLTDFIINEYNQKKYTFDISGKGT